MTYLKHLTYLDTSTNWLTEQFVIIAKNSCLVKKNGQVKTRLFKTGEITTTLLANGSYDIMIKVAYVDGNEDTVVEYGLREEELNAMIAMYKRHC
jgi:hypothetical protein